MPEIIRSIAARMRGLISDRRQAPRYVVRLPAFISLSDLRSNGRERTKKQSLSGYTRDVSLSGLALVVPGIRIGDRYLSSAHETLSVRLDISGSPVQLMVRPVRYEPLETDDADHEYLIGVAIMDMSNEDRTRFADYLSTLSVKAKRY